MKFFYLRDENRNPIACVASDYEFDTNMVVFAVSTHNPRDHFSKDIAKQVAAGRLEVNTNWYTHLPMKKGIKWDILKHIAFDTSLPAKTRKAATLWLNSHQTQR
jgi:hypothetical protein